MKNYAVIQGRSIALSSLDAIQVVANRFGLEVDIEETRITATRADGSEFVVRGATYADLAEKFAEKVLKLH